MQSMKIGRLEFNYSGETLEIHRDGKQLCTVPLAEVLMFGREWEKKHERLAREAGMLHITPSIMDTKVSDYQQHGSLDWD